PVINVDAVRNRENPSVDEIIYLCSFSGLILENSQFEQYIKDIDIKIENLKMEISLNDDRINGLSGDLQKVSAFLQNYTKEKVQEVSARAVTEKMQLQDLNETIAQKREKRKSIECEKSALREKVEKLNEMIKDSAEKEEKLRKLIRKSDELRQVREQLGYRKKELDEVNRIINDIRSEIKDLENRKNIVSQEIDQVRLRLYDSKKELDSLISFDAVKTDSSKVEVQALFNSLSAAISGRLADEERLRREIEDYRTSLSRLTGKVLRDYGKNLAEFEKREAMGERIEIPS